MGRILNRKGHGLDTILAVAVVFGLALTLLIGVYTYDKFVDIAENSTMNDSSTAMTAMKDMQTHNNLWDYVVLLVFFGFVLAMMILGYFVDVHTIFFPLFILVMLIGVILASVFSYVWDKIADTSTFTVLKVASFPITSHLMDNLVVYYTIAAGLALIATYAKTRGDA